MAKDMLSSILLLSMLTCSVFGVKKRDFGLAFRSFARDGRVPRVKSGRIDKSRSVWLAWRKRKLMSDLLYWSGKVEAAELLESVQGLAKPDPSAKLGGSSSGPRTSVSSGVKLTKPDLSASLGGSTYDIDNLAIIASKAKAKEPVVLIGDSGLAHPQGFLAQSLQKDFEVIQHARGGWTTNNVLGNRDFKPLQQNFKDKVVILSVGGNDILTKLDEIIQEFQKCGAIIYAQENAFSNTLYKLYDIISGQELKNIIDRQKQILDQILSQTPKVIYSLQYRPAIENTLFEDLPLPWRVKRFLDDCAQYMIEEVRKEMEEYAKERGIALADMLETFPATTVKYIGSKDPIHLDIDGVHRQKTLYTKIIKSRNESDNWSEGMVYNLTEEDNLQKLSLGTKTLNSGSLD